MTLSLPESLSSEPKKRTLDDVYAERGKEYPKRRQTLSNRAERSDFLIVAYALMTRRKSDALSIILSKTGTERATVLMSFKPVGGQLGLWGIIKKVLSYDHNMDIATPSVDDVETLLLEMQDLFAPVKKVVYVAPIVEAHLPPAISSPSTEIVPRTFMGRPVVSPYVLAILDGLQAEVPKAPEPALETLPPHPETSQTESVGVVSEQVQSRIAPLLPVKPEPPVFRRPNLPASPRRGYGQQQVGHRRWEIPYHLRGANTVPTDENTVESPVGPELQQPKYDIPHFDDLRDTLVYLREKTDWHDFYRHIELQLRDDLAVMSYLAQQNGELRAVLVSVKRKFSTSMKQIISYLFHPDTIPVTPSPDQAAVLTAEEELKTEVVEQTEDPLEVYIRLFDRFKFNDRYMSVVRDICHLHMQRRYEEFLKRRNEFFETGKKRKNAYAELFDINAALSDIVLAQQGSDQQKKIDKTTVMFDLCEYRADQGALFSYDATQEALYKEYEWTRRIPELLVENNLLRNAFDVFGFGGGYDQILEKKGPNMLTKEIYDAMLASPESDKVISVLKVVYLTIPRENAHRWKGYNEAHARETNLYQIFADMIEHRHKGASWNGRIELDELKEFMRKLKFSESAK